MVIFMSVNDFIVGGFCFCGGGTCLFFSLLLLILIMVVSVVLS